MHPGRVPPTSPAERTPGQAPLLICSPELPRKGTGFDLLKIDRFDSVCSSASHFNQQSLIRFETNSANVSSSKVTAMKKQKQPIQDPGVTPWRARSAACPWRVTQTPAVLRGRRDAALRNCPGVWLASRQAARKTPYRWLLRTPGLASTGSTCPALGPLSLDFRQHTGQPWDPCSVPSHL